MSFLNDELSNVETNQNHLIEVNKNFCLFCWNIQKRFAHIEFNLPQLQGAEDAQEKEQQQEQDLMMELESAAGDTTPLSVPSLVDDLGISPEECTDGKPTVEVFELQESSSDAESSEMEAEKLFIKLKEVCSNFA